MPAERSKKRSKAARKAKSAPINNTPVGDQRSCRYCGDPFNPRGLATHEKRCQELVELALSDVQFDLSRGKHQGTSIAFRLMCYCVSTADIFHPSTIRITFLLYRVSRIT